MEYPNLLKAERELKETTTTQKSKIILLAEAYERGIQSKDTDILKKMRKFEDKSPDVSDICSVICKFVEDEGICNKRRVTEALDSKYKRRYEHTEHERDANWDIIDAEVQSLAADLLDGEDGKVKAMMMYEMLKDTATNEQKKRNPRKSDTPELKPNNIKDHHWVNPLAEEFAQLAIKLEGESKNYSTELMEKLAKIIKSIRDSRHVASVSEMESIILVAEYGTSLKNVSDSQTYYLDRETLHENERSCTKCVGGLIGCMRNSCTCLCHNVVKRGTSKGVKYARDTDKELKELSDKIKLQRKKKTADLCNVGKVILFNVRHHKQLSIEDQKGAMLDHLQSEDCILCADVVREWPKYFEGES